MKAITLPPPMPKQPETLDKLYRTTKLRVEENLFIGKWLIWF